DAAANLGDGAILAGPFAQQGLRGGVDESLFTGAADDADDDEHGEDGAGGEEQRQCEGADGRRGAQERRGLRGEGGGGAAEGRGPAAPGGERDEDGGGGGGAEGADGAEEDSGEPDRDRDPASGPALEGFDRTVGGEELLPAMAVGRQVLTQLLRGQDLRVQLPARDPAPVAEENEGQADEGERA